MSWEQPTKEEHREFSSCYLVWHGVCHHEGWDMRWSHQRTFKTDESAISLAKRLDMGADAARVVRCWWDGTSFQSDVIFEIRRSK